MVTLELYWTTKSNISNQKLFNGKMPFLLLIYWKKTFRFCCPVIEACHIHNLLKHLLSGLFPFNNWNYCSKILYFDGIFLVVCSYLIFINTIRLFTWHIPTEHFLLPFFIEKNQIFRFSFGYKILFNSWKYLDVK